MRVHFAVMSKIEAEATRFEKLRSKNKNELAELMLKKIQEGYKVFKEPWSAQAAPKA